MKIHIIALLLVALAGNNACKKLDYTIKTVTFGNIYFINSTALSNNLGVRSNGEALNWQGNGLIRGVTGELKMEFYDKRTGKTLSEKVVNIKATNPERYILFQPDSSAQIAFLNPNSQAEEAAAPAGYMKIKIANYTKAALPDEKIDIVFHSTTVSAVKFGPVDTIKNVGRSLETASYFLVKRGVRSGAIQPRYKLSFINHDTKAEILSSNGALYLSASELNTNSSPAAKGVYTIYLTDMERTANAVWLLRGNLYYDVSTNVLFKD